MLLTHIEAFFSQKYALFSNHCPLLPNCFLRLKEDNNRSVAAFTLVSRAAGKLDVRAGCVCGERCAVCGQLSPTSATCPPRPCRCPRTQQRLPRLQQHSGDALEILYSILYYPRCLAFIHWYMYCLVSPSWHMCYQLSCRKDQPRQRCIDCLKTKRRNASVFLEQLRWSNQAPAGKCKTLRRNRRNPIQVSLYSKSNIALFHIIINDKCFLMTILGFPG